MGQTRKRVLNWRSILEGVVIGVTVAIILGVYQLGNELIERRTQMRYIREIVAVARDQMSNAAELTVSGFTASPDEIRHTIFQEMYANVDSALSVADKIPFEQKVELKLALRGVDIALKGFANVGIRAMNLGVQEDLFNHLATAVWLKIPDR